MNLDEIEMVKIYWEEFKYRHDHYWKSFFKFSFAILFLLVLPFMYPEKISKFGKLQLIIPILSMILSLASAWLLASEYERIKVANQKFQELKKTPFDSIIFSTQNIGFKKILNFKIGTVVSILFAVVFFLLSTLELYLLFGKC